MSGAGRGVTPGADPDGRDEAPAAEAGGGAGASTDEASSEGQAEGPAENPEPGAASASPGPEGKRKAASRPRRKRSFWREFPVLVVVALLLAVVIKTYAIQAFFIPSGSMENTLEINDRVLVNKLVYDVRGIHRGDIVVFNGDGSWDPGTVPVDTNFVVKFADGFASMFGFGHPGDILIKRVIGIPGDHVACCDAQGQVTVNGVPLNEGTYLYPGSAPSVSRFNITVSAGRLWVMGDNRFYSADSRAHQGDPGGGTIPESGVIGRAFIIIWPLSRWRLLPIPATFQQSALNGSHAAASAGGAAPAGDAGLISARLEPTGQAIPLVLGFAGAVPLTWLQRRVRMRVARRGRRAEPRA
jgi:signal peptidase I